VAYTEKAILDLRGHDTKERRSKIWGGEIEALPRTLRAKGVSWRRGWRLRGASLKEGHIKNLTQRHIGLIAPPAGARC